MTRSNEQLSEPEIFDDLSPDRAMPPDLLIDIASDEYVLAVGDRIFLPHMLQRSVKFSISQAEESKYLRLDQPLPETPQLLVPEKRDSGGAIFRENGNSTPQQRRRMARVRIRK